MSGRHRVKRLNELFRRELSRMALSELKDPRLDGLVVTDVSTARDLSFATVYVRASDVEEAIEGLDHASGYIRRQLGQALHLRRIPEFRFVADETLERANRIEELLREARGDGDRGD